MNTEKIFQALEDDSENSAHGIICQELESQGYRLKMNGIDVDSDGFFEGAYKEIEKDINPIKITLFKGGIKEQEFSIEFIEFHEIIIRK